MRHLPWEEFYDDLGSVQMAFKLTTIPESASAMLIGTTVLVLLRLHRRRMT